MNFHSSSRGTGSGDPTLLFGWLAVFVLAVIAYWPGLGGPFMLDDFGSVAAMGHRGGVTNWETFKAFVFGGASGPTGRPISLLSFLIDAQDWPAEAWPFKRTNLVIHLMNGVLLGFISYRVLRIVHYPSRDASWIALLAVAFWLLHPFLVSTTLYVVQRMAQLSTLFVLAGIALYIRGRAALDSSLVRGYLTMSIAVVAGTLFAMLSKENGILLPVLVGVLELTIFANRKPPSAVRHRAWLAVFVALPTVVILLYLGERFTRDNFLNIVPPRDFSIYERLITQPRILLDYLQQWLIPKLYTTGVFQDHFLKSEGLLSPATTLLAIVVNAAAVVAAWVVRRRWPLVAFAVLFFYAAHLLESTVINLELYFEHRNYLAAAFLFLPLAALARSRLNPRRFLLLGVFVALLLGGFTRYSSGVWKSFPSIVEASARKAPTSARAQAQYSVMLFAAGLHEESLRVLDDAIRKIPRTNPLLVVNRLTTLCNMNRLTAEELDEQATILSGLPYNARSVTVYTALLDEIAQERCPEISTRRLNVMFREMLSVPFNADTTTLEHSHLRYYTGYTYANIGRPQEAVAEFHKSLEARPGASHAMQMASILATYEYFAEALALSDIALQQLGEETVTVTNAATVTVSDINNFQAIVRADLAARQAQDSPRPDE